MIALDKCTHFLACYAVTMTVGINSTPEIGALIGLAVGLGKEAYDKRPGGSGWDWYDVVADVAGVIVGYVVLNCIRWLKNI